MCFVSLEEKYSREAGGLTSPVFMIARVICSSLLGDAGSHTTTRHEEEGERLEQVQLLSDRAGFGAPAHAQFAVDAADLGLNGIGRNDQLARDLGIRAPGD